MFSTLITIIEIGALVSFFSSVFTKLFSSETSDSDVKTTIDASTLFRNTEREHERKKEIIELEKGYQKELKDIDHKFETQMKKLNQETQKIKNEHELAIKRIEIDLEKDKLHHQFKIKFLDLTLDLINKKMVIIETDLEEINQAYTTFGELQKKLLLPPEKSNV